MSLYTVCAVLALAQLTAGYVELDVNPSEVLDGLTQTLTVNCSFTYSGASYISNLTSLVLTKTNSSDSEHHIMRLASIDVDTPNQISTPFLDNDTLSGLIGAYNESYLAIEWSYPTEEQTGKYFCEAHGVDDDGYTSGITKIAEVILTETNGLHGLIERFSKLQRQLDHQKDIAKSQTETLDYLASLIKNQSETITSQQSQIEILLNQTKAQSNTIGELRSEFGLFKNLVRDFEISGERYYGQYYILSKEGWNNSTEADRICKTDGGSLAKIGTSDEFQFIKQFLDGYSGFTEVLVSGTDEGHDGNWTYSNSDEELCFTDWGAGEPRQSQDNCLVLHRSYQWQMFTFPCVHSHVDIKFVCEVNNMY